MSDLANIMSLASEEMKASLAKARVALTHNLSKGEAAEEAVRKFYTDHLPSSVGITSGQIIDVAGNRSKQLDVIIYNKMRTPLLFTSEENGHQLVPSEGVIAVIEVKTKLTKTEVPGIVANMESVKQLQKSAYYKENSVIVETFNLYGKTYEIMPSLYFVFAYEGSNIVPIVDEFRNCQTGKDIDKKIDCVCVLDQGVIVYADSQGKFDGIPMPTTELGVVKSTDSLLIFYLLTSRFILQSKSPAIRLQDYLTQTLK